MIARADALEAENGVLRYALTVRDAEIVRLHSELARLHGGPQQLLPGSRSASAPGVSSMAGGTAPSLHGLALLLWWCSPTTAGPSHTHPNV